MDGWMEGGADGDCTVHVCAAHVAWEKHLLSPLPGTYNNNGE